jgi:hypothetical protein
MTSGNAGYNLSKAGVKVFTEQRESPLLSIVICAMLIYSRPRAQKYSLELYCPSLRVRPALLTSPVLMNSPGWVWTPLAGASSGKDKPNAPWTAEQTVDYMFEKVFDNGDFYVICPDNEVTSVSTPLYRQSRADEQNLDKARIAWSLGDVLENRPALSRWHPSCEFR